MIVDTSAIVAILTREPEARQFGRLLYAADAVRMSAGSRIELGVVIARRFPHIDRTRVETILADFGTVIVPVTERHVALADAGYREYGQASTSPAKLTFGDCFAYALAKDTGEPLLFKGDDFSHTDVTPAA